VHNVTAGERSPGLLGRRTSATGARVTSRPAQPGPACITVMLRCTRTTMAGDRDGGWRDAGRRTWAVAPWAVDSVAAGRPPAYGRLRPASHREAVEPHRTHATRPESLTATVGAGPGGGDARRAKRVALPAAVQTFNPGLPSLSCTAAAGGAPRTAVDDAGSATASTRTILGELAGAPVYLTSGLPLAAFLRGARPETVRGRRRSAGPISSSCRPAGPWQSVSRGLPESRRTAGAGWPSDGRGRARCSHPGRGLAGT